MKLDLLMAGVGGQGIVLASDIVAEAALQAGYDTKKTDTLGMAQRGGSVVSHVRIGDKVWSPLIREGEAELLVSFEKLEAARWGSYLSPGGLAIINRQVVPPLSVSRGVEHYPTDTEIANLLKQRTDRIIFVDGTARAGESGDLRTLNILMLGGLSFFVPSIGVGVWKESICRHLPAKAHAMNLKAFDFGRKEIRNVHPR